MDESQQAGSQAVETGSGAKWTLIGFAIASAGAALLYRIVRHEGLGHTSAMFIGFPALLAILLAWMPRPKSTTGAIMKGITLAILITAPLLGEGFICILISSPLFYVVGLAVGQTVDWNRRRRGLTLSCCALLLLPMSLEGVVPALTFDRMQTVEVTRTVDGSATEVEAALAGSPRLSKALPWVLRIGFPRPLEARGEGLEIGALRTVHFTGAEGMPPGDVVTRVAARGDGWVRTEMVSDGTKLASWMTWESSEVRWRPLDATHTAVTWRITFARQLDPAWYFAPWERLVVSEVAGYMIAANATPAGER